MNQKTGKGNSDILKNIIITILIITFFVGILIAFYIMLYDAKREIIIKNGETTAKETAEKFDDYLSTSKDAIKLTAYTIEGMIAEHDTNENILEYLVGQTVAIKSAVFENTSGLYGYIQGEFLDGLRWEPPEGFVATERPWYIKAKEKDGEVAMVEPYLDAQTGTILIAISKMLKDNQSVVSMDITLEYIQKITEEAVSDGKSDLQIIIDDTGYVVTHSDKGEVGKKYSEEKDSLGAMIYRKVKETDISGESYFEINYDNKQYIIYAADLQSDFYCISAKDATAVFTPLIAILLITVGAVIIVVTVIILILIMSNRKQRVLEVLSKQLSATADIYISLHEIDFLTDTFTEVRNNHSQAAAMLNKTRTNCQEMIRMIMTKFADPAYRDAVLDFVDFSNLNLRLKTRNTMTIEWLDVDKQWRRSRYIVSDRTPTGMIARAVYLIEDIDAEKRERDKTLEALKMVNTQISSIANVYFSMYDIDLKNDTCREIKTHASNISGVLDKPVANAQKTAFESIDSIAGEVSRAKMHQFVDFSTLEERLKEANNVTEEFLDKRNIWLRGRFVVSKCADDGTLEHVLWLVESIDDEMKKRETLTQAAQTLNYRISSISNIYMTVHEINLANDTFIEIKADKKYIDKSESEIHANAQETLRRVMASFTDESSVEDMMRFIDFSTIEQRLRRAETITIEYMNKKKLWRRGRFVASRRDDRGRLTHVLWLAEDIDEEKQERDKLIDMSERAIAASEAKSSFLSNMSHEIRTPINAVLGMNEMILRESDDTNIITYSNNIKNAGTTLLGIVNDILDFSKIEAGKMEIIPVDYDLSSMINDLVNMIQTKADDKGLKLILDINNEMPKQLHGDEIRIKQVITNILTNAVKYTQKGSVTFSINYEKIPKEPDSVFLDIAVKDTGIGIKKEDLRKLFSEFERIEEERNRKVEGTGLGMSITKRLLEMMGTTLEVESIYKLGSKFSFRLKQKVVGWDALGDYQAAYKAAVGARTQYHEKFRAPDAKVLVVDDTAMNLNVFQHLIKKTGVKADTATSGDEGIALSRKTKYDIIFLDHMMPGKDGIQTLHEMRSRPDDKNLDTPAICLTANAISGAREKYLEEGFDDYLTKPIEPEKLEEMLMRYLSDDKMQESGSAAAAAAEKPAVSEPEPGEDDGSVIPGYVRKIAELDTAKGIKNNGSEEGYVEAMQIYAEMIDDITAETEKYWLDGDLENAVIKIHAMKSTSRIIGAVEIGELAQALEDAGKNGDRDKVAERIDELLKRCRDLGAQLKPLCGGKAEEDESDKPPISPEEIKELYTAITEFMSVADYDSAVQLIEGLRNYSVPDSEKARCDALMSAAADVEYEKISEILK